jgi:hypothetical protein
MSKLTAAERNALPDSAFAEPSLRKYPMNDANHARNALARVSQFGSSQEKSEVKTKARSGFPSIRQKQ